MYRYAKYFQCPNKCNQTKKKTGNILTVETSNLSSAYNFYTHRAHLKQF